MRTFPTELKFKYPWRSYQSRVLTELEKYLDDDYLHIVAAPGSGKTVLGLEVVRRLNAPYLILAPTITIRNQWIDRLIHLFIPERSACPTWISYNIKEPAIITVSTYQALHTAYRSLHEDVYGDDIDDQEDLVRKNCILKAGSYKNNNLNLPGLLFDVGVKVLVLDEAHHLRTEWWKSLIDVKKKLDNPKIVALTATPPYDVADVEWKRYQDLCGPIDAEISVPELVKEKNLCPHQDYVYFSTPSIEEEERINKFRSAVKEYLNDLSENQPFLLRL